MRISSPLQSFLGDRRGSAGILIAGGLLTLIASVGIGIDTVLAYSVQDQMQKALDAAGLSAGKSTGDDATLRAEARAIFDANFVAATAGLARLNAFDVTPASDRATVSLSASATMPTKIMRLFGHDEVTVTAETVINRMVRAMELVLVMDNTGSMKQNDMIGSMKTAAKNLVDIVYGGAESHPNLWVGLVPYTATVNIGSQYTDWLKPGDRALQSPSPFAPSTWKGCVEARANGYDQTDDPPDVEEFTSFFYASAVEGDNLWPPLKEEQSYENSGTGPNLGCGPPILPLTQARSTVRAAIDLMAAWHRGGTTSNLGLVWGWRVLSPRWRMWWDGVPASLPLAYNTPLMDKVIVLLTDGQNQFYDHNKSDSPKSDYTAYGRLEDFGFSTLSAARQEIDTRMTSICAAIKANNIILYTITFGPTPDATTQSLYRSCATRPEFYYHSPTGTQLSAAFRTIGTQLSNLRLSK